jgi:hypothetical protein
MEKASMFSTELSDYLANPRKDSHWDQLIWWLLRKPLCFLTYPKNLQSPAVWWKIGI